LSLVFSLSHIQVDKHIRRLDADLARFEADLKEKTLSSHLKSDSDTGKKGLKTNSIYLIEFSLM